MKQDGFTLLELLTVIALVSVLSTLCYQAYDRTHESTSRINQRSDSLIETVELVDSIIRECQRLAADYPVLCDRNEMQFTCRRGDDFVPIHIKITDSGITLTGSSHLKEQQWKGHGDITYFQNQAWTPDPDMGASVELVRFQLTTHAGESGMVSFVLPIRQSVSKTTDALAVSKSGAL